MNNNNNNSSNTNNQPRTTGPPRPTRFAQDIPQNNSQTHNNFNNNNSGGNYNNRSNQYNPNYGQNRPRFNPTHNQGFVSNQGNMLQMNPMQNNNSSNNMNPPARGPPLPMIPPQPPMMPPLNRPPMPMTGIPLSSAPQQPNSEQMLEFLKRAQLAPPTAGMGLPPPHPPATGVPPPPPPPAPSAPIITPTATINTERINELKLQRENEEKVKKQLRTKELEEQAKKLEEETRQQALKKREDEKLARDQLQQDKKTQMEEEKRQKLLKLEQLKSEKLKKLQQAKAVADGAASTSTTPTTDSATATSIDNDRAFNGLSITECERLFLTILKDTRVTQNTLWAQLLPTIVMHPHYHAVPSSVRRKELFELFVAYLYTNNGRLYDIAGHLSVEDKRRFEEQCAHALLLSDDIFTPFGRDSAAGPIRPGESMDWAKGDASVVYDTSNEAGMTALNGSKQPHWWVDHIMLNNAKFNDNISPETCPQCKIVQFLDQYYQALYRQQKEEDDNASKPNRGGQLSKFVMDTDIKLLSPNMMVSGELRCPAHASSAPPSLHSFTPIVGAPRYRPITTSVVPKALTLFTNAEFQHRYHTLSQQYLRGAMTAALVKVIMAFCGTSAGICVTEAELVLFNAIRYRENYALLPLSDPHLTGDDRTIRQYSIRSAAPLSSSPRVVAVYPSDSPTSPGGAVRLGAPLYRQHDVGGANTSHAYPQMTDGDFQLLISAACPAMGAGEGQLTTLLRENPVYTNSIVALLRLQNNYKKMYDVEQGLDGTKPSPLRDLEVNPHKYRQAVFDKFVKPMIITGNPGVCRLGGNLTYCVECNKCHCCCACTFTSTTQDSVFIPPLIPHLLLTTPFLDNNTATQNYHPQYDPSNTNSPAGGTSTNNLTNKRFISTVITTLYNHPVFQSIAAALCPNFAYDPLIHNNNQHSPNNRDNNINNGNSSDDSTELGRLLANSMTTGQRILSQCLQYVIPLISYKLSIYINTINNIRTMMSVVFISQGLRQKIDKIYAGMYQEYVNKTQQEFISAQQPEQNDYTSNSQIPSENNPKTTIFEEYSDDEDNDDKMGNNQQNNTNSSKGSIKLSFTQQLMDIYITQMLEQVIHKTFAKSKNVIDSLSSGNLISDSSVATLIKKLEREVEERTTTNIMNDTINSATVPQHRVKYLFNPLPRMKSNAASGSSDDQSFSQPHWLSLLLLNRSNQHTTTLQQELLISQSRRELRPMEDVQDEISTQNYINQLCQNVGILSPMFPFSFILFPPIVDYSHDIDHDDVNNQGTVNSLKKLPAVTLPHISFKTCSSHLLENSPMYNVNHNYGSIHQCTCLHNLCHYNIQEDQETGPFLSCLLHFLMSFSTFSYPQYTQHVGSALNTAITPANNDEITQTSTTSAPNNDTSTPPSTAEIYPPLEYKYTSIAQRSTINTTNVTDDVNIFMIQSPYNALHELNIPTLQSNNIYLDDKLLSKYNMNGIVVTPNTENSLNDNSTPVANAFNATSQKSITFQPIFQINGTIVDNILDCVMDHIQNQVQKIRPYYDAIYKDLCGELTDAIQQCQEGQTNPNSPTTTKYNFLSTFQIIYNTIFDAVKKIDRVIDSYNSKHISLMPDGTSLPPPPMDSATLEKELTEHPNTEQFDSNIKTHIFTTSDLLKLYELIQQLTAAASPKISSKDIISKHISSTLSTNIYLYHCIRQDVSILRTIESTIRQEEVNCFKFIALCHQHITPQYILSKIKAVCRSIISNNKSNSTNSVSTLLNSTTPTNAQNSSHIIKIQDVLPFEDAKHKLGAPLPPPSCNSYNVNCQHNNQYCLQYYFEHNRLQMYYTKLYNTICTALKQ